ncbi:hypothetical protein [Brachyspira sp.]|uniref:hypothetical protein n=1 Tax=Brachyspira sp. TaxID=1977261 RepID=UPI00261DC59C|nr:hypothetical protein [Brachyspira sp.]
MKKTSKNIKRVIIYNFIIIFFICIFSSSQKLYANYPNGNTAGFFLRFSFPSEISLGMTGKFDSIPFMFSGVFNIGISTKGFAWFGITSSADWWGLKHRIGEVGNSIAWIYFGPGVEVDIQFGNNYWNLGLAFRLPLGVSFIVDRDWEIFLQIAPGLNVIAIGNEGFSTFGWYPSNTGWSFSKFFRFSGDFGFRYWF